MPKYNHAVTIAFECLSDNREGPTDEEYRQGLLKRVQELEESKAWGQANVDAPFDTYFIKGEKSYEVALESGHTGPLVSWEYQPGVFVEGRLWLHQTDLDECDVYVGKCYKRLATYSHLDEDDAHDILHTWVFEDYPEVRLIEESL